MTDLTGLKTILTGTGLPVAYGFFPEEANISPPCITYQIAYSSNTSADNKTYHKVQNVDIFLFTKTKDTASEALLESALDSASIPYQTTETYLSDEAVYQIIYEIKIQG